MRLLSCIWRCAIAGLIAACHPGGPSSKPLLVRHTPEETGITFRNQLFESDRLNILSWEYFYNGGGVGIGDLNNDQLPDVFFTGNMTGCRLYLNKGGFRFEDITRQAGIDTRGQWASGVSMADVNADGWLDLYVCMAGPYPADQRRNRLYINQQGLHFEDQAAKFGLADTGHTTQAAFFDYDRDGDLDCYLLTNMMEELGPNVIRPKKLDGSAVSNDRLYRNDGGRFTQVTREAGIVAEGYGLGVSVCDLNRDGWPDLYISNDYLSNDLLWINQQDGTFRDEAARYFRHSSYSAMGNDAADIDNDGLTDLLTVDMLPATHQRQKLMFGVTNYDRYRSELQYGYTPQLVRNTLQLNQGMSPAGDPLFAEVGQLAGVHSTDWSWSALFADLDLDGWRDLLITNGYPRDITNLDFVHYKAGALFGEQRNRMNPSALAQTLAEVPGVCLPNRLFRNGGQLQFEDVSEAWGFGTPACSHGMALGDLDRDGDLDVVISNLEDPAFVYENRAGRLPGRHFLNVRFEGPPLNPGGIGAEVELFSCGVRRTAAHYPVRGYQSSMEPGIFLGLGSCSLADSLLVRWPDGREQRLRQVPAGQSLVVRHADAGPPAPAPSAVPAPYFRDITGSLGTSFRHADPEYPDFKIQPLLPHKHSLLGPGLAAGDVNGDGRADFFAGGAYQQHGQLYICRPDGSYRGQPLDKGPKYEEDQGACFLDADLDGDLDLYIASGSSEFPADHPAYQHRLYLNDGQGHFSRSQDRLPPFRVSGSCAEAADFDRDGDLDLFAGGRLTPHAYPRIPRSYLLQNDGGYFKDVTPPALQAPGMVSAACWADLDQDGWPELILAGEWMPLSVAWNRQGQLSELSALPASTGWWNSLAAADLDQDGDLDLAAGNLGLNSRLKTSPEQPVSLYVNDFNADGRLDAFLCHYLDGAEVPFHSRDDLFRQVNELRRSFPTYASFAAAGWADLFTPEQQAGMTRLQAVCFASVWAENLGGGRFTLHELPLAAQVAPVYALLPGDFDGDGRTDLLLSGNSQATEVQTGPYDALNGLLLTGDGHGGFVPHLPGQSGWYVPGDGRALAFLPVAEGQPLILAAQNNGPLLVFRQERRTGAGSP